jgi:hypothetical protein
LHAAQTARLHTIHLQSMSIQTIVYIIWKEWRFSRNLSAS